MMNVILPVLLDYLVIYIIYIFVTFKYLGLSEYLFTLNHGVTNHIPYHNQIFRSDIFKFSNNGDNNC